MAETVGYATLNVIPSAKGFGKALNGQMAPHLSSAGAAGGTAMGEKLKAVAAPLFALAGTVAMGAFVKNAIDAAGDLEQSIGAIDTVFKDSSGLMHTWAKGASMDVGLARNEYNELATLIGTQLNNAYRGTGKTMAEIGTQTNDLIGLGADLSSMFGGTSREAVEALSSALKGERDPIERYGVSLTQAAIDAKAAELGFQKVGGALSGEANAAATLALIMEQTNDAHGNFAKEGTTYQGVLQRLSAGWSNITATIGAGFLPFATAAASVLLSMLPSIQGAADHFAAFGASMQTAFEQAGGGLPGIAAMFRTIFTDIAAWFTGGGLMELLTSWQTMQGQLITAIATALPQLTSQFGTMIPALMTGFLGLIQQVGTQLLPQLMNNLVLLVQTVATALPGLVQLLGVTLQAAIPLLLESATLLFESLVTALVTTGPVILQTLMSALESVANVVMEKLPMLLQTGVELFTQLVTAVLTVLPVLIQTFVGTVLPNVLTTLLGMLPQLLQTGVELFMMIVQAIITVLPTILQTLIGQVLPNVLTTLLGMLPQLLQTGIQLFMMLVQAVIKVLPQLLQTLLGDVLPNTLTTILSMLPQLLSTGFELFMMLVKAVLQMLPQLLSVLLSDVLPAVLNAVADMLPELLVAGVDLFMQLVTSALDIIPDLVQVIVFQVIPALIDAVMQAAPKLLDAGVNLIQGLVRGIWDSAASVGSALLDIAQNAVDDFLGFFGIHSPSRLMMAYGVNVGEGFVIGVDNMSKPVAKAFVGMGKSGAKALAKTPAVFETLGKLTGAGLAKGLVASESSISKTLGTLGTQIEKAFKAAASSKDGATKKLATLNEKLEALGAKELAQRKATQSKIADETLRHDRRMVDLQERVRSLTAKDAAAVQAIQDKLSAAAEAHGNKLEQLKAKLAAVTAKEQAQAAATQAKIADATTKHNRRIVDLNARLNAALASGNADRIAAARRAIAYENEDHGNAVSKLQATLKSQTSGIADAKAAIERENESYAKSIAKLRATVTDPAALEAAKRALENEKSDHARKLATLQSQLSTVDTAARKKILDQIAAQKVLIAEADRALKVDQSKLLQRIEKAEGALGKLAEKREALADRMKDATRDLESAMQLRDDFGADLANSIRSADDITQMGSVRDMADAMRQRIASTQKFTETAKKLQALGLNDAAYKDLVEGFAKNGSTDAAEAILAGGSSAVKELNALQAQMEKVTGSFGDTAAKHLYQSGVDMAAGIVKGLESQDAALVKQMEKLGESLAASLRKSLGIHSPSRVMAVIGAFTGSGLAQGIASTANAVIRAAQALGLGAIGAVDDLPPMALGAALDGRTGVDRVVGSSRPAAGSTTTNSTVNYTHNGGDGLTSEQQLRKAVNRLKPR